MSKRVHIHIKRHPLQIPQTFTTYRRHVALIMRQAILNMAYERIIDAPTATRYNAKERVLVNMDYEGSDLSGVFNGFNELAQALTDNANAGIRRIDEEGIWLEAHADTLHDVIINYLNIRETAERDEIVTAMKRYGFSIH